MPPQLLVDVIVPARDHAASLAPLLRDLPHRHIRSVVVIDRASTDRTAEIARDSGALVLREPTGNYGAAMMRATRHFSSLPRVPDALVIIPGDRPAAAAAVPALVEPIAERGVELVLGVEQGRKRVSEKLAMRVLETVYRQRWSGVGPVRALRFPALIALGMADRGEGWDLEMLVRAVKLGLTCDEVVLPADPAHKTRVGSRALLHLLRHATLR